MTIKDLSSKKKSSIRNLIDGLEKRYKLNIFYLNTSKDFLMGSYKPLLLIALELTKKKGV